MLMKLSGSLDAIRYNETGGTYAVGSHRSQLEKLSFGASHHVRAIYPPSPKRIKTPNQGMRVFIPYKRCLFG